MLDAIHREDWGAVPKHLSIDSSLKEWIKGSRFSVDGATISYAGKALPEGLTTRIFAMSSAGESPKPLFNFWERLIKNPSMRSVEQLFPFLKHEGIPLTEDGCFLAYKAVREDYKDVHSGKFSNKPGVINEMPRNEISDDPNQACHEGFHVGALGYAKSFHSGGHVVVCKVDPEHVVCVPYDASQQKMRVCKYEVIGNYGSQLPNTVYIKDENDRETVAADYEENDPEEESDENSYDRDEPAATTKSVGSGRVDPDKKKMKFPRLDRMAMDELMEEPIETLRKYAGKGLAILGASKIPGGKTALVTRILQVRG